jgi:hypothetical protein
MRPVPEENTLMEHGMAMAAVVAYRGKMDGGFG